MRRVCDVIPMTGGIFTAMDYDFAGSNLLLMDMMLQEACGDRLVSPFIERLMPKFSDSKQLPDETLKALGMMILSQYKHKWDGWNELYHLSYDPIHNYLDKMEESVSDLLSSSDQECSQSQTSSLENSTHTAASEQQSEQISSDERRVEGKNFTESVDETVHSGTDVEEKTLDTTTTLSKSGGSDTIVNSSGSSSEQLSGSDTVEKTLALKDVKSINSDKTEKFSDNTTDKTVTDGGLTTTRTDNLKDVKTSSDSATDTRTDDLHQQSTQDESSDGQSVSDDSVHAFNSGDGVTTSENAAVVSGDSASQLATFSTTVHGIPSESNLQASKGSSHGSGSVDNTGTQRNEHSGESSDSVDHTGTQETVEANNSTVNHTVTGSKDTTITEEGGETIDHTGTETTESTYGKKVEGSTSGNSSTKLTLDETDTTVQSGGDKLNKTYGERIDVSGQVGESVDTSSTTMSQSTAGVQSQTTGAAIKDASQLANSQRLADSLATASRTRTVVRQGNIGNITTQRFILEQIEVLRQNFIQEVINDVKNFITVPIYK